MKRCTERHVKIQEVFDQAGKQIAEAVRAIKEREERDRKEKQKAKSKDAPVKASIETNAGPESNHTQKDSDPAAKEPLPQNLGLLVCEAPAVAKACGPLYATRQT